MTGRRVVVLGARRFEGLPLVGVVMRMALHDEGGRRRVGSMQARGCWSTDRPGSMAGATGLRRGRTLLSRGVSEWRPTATGGQGDESVNRRSDGQVPRRRKASDDGCHGPSSEVVRCDDDGEGSDSGNGRRRARRGSGVAGQFCDSSPIAAWAAWAAWTTTGGPQQWHCTVSLAAQRGYYNTYRAGCKTRSRRVWAFAARLRCVDLESSRSCGFRWGWTIEGCPFWAWWLWLPVNQGRLCCLGDVARRAVPRGLEGGLGVWASAWSERYKQKVLTPPPPGSGCAPGQQRMRPLAMEERRRTAVCREKGRLGWMEDGVEG